MLGAPPAFILSQDRTLRSVSAGRSRRRCSARRSVPSKIPLISDSLKLTSLCVRDSNFAGLSSSISRSQYPVLKVPPRRAAAVAAPSRGEYLYAPRAPARARKSPSTFSAQFGGRGAASGGGPRDAEMPLVGQRRPALPRTRSAVPSALGGLTSGFGMGPGVPPLPWSLTNKGHSASGARRRALRAAQRDVGAPSGTLRRSEDEEKSSAD